MIKWYKLNLFATTPCSSDLVESVVIIGSDRGHQIVKSVLVLSFYGSNSKNCSGLLVDNLTETSFTLNDTVRDIHLPAEGRHPHDQLDRVNVVSDDNQLSFLLLNKSGDVVQTELDYGWLLASLSLAAVSHALQTVLLLGSSLGFVLFEKLKEVGSCLLVQCLSELVDAGRDLQSLVQGFLLTLETHILGPPHKPPQISLGLDVSTDTEVLGSLLDQGVGGFLGRLGGIISWGCRSLLYLFDLWHPGL